MISRIALFTCFLLGVTCVTSQQATIQSQLSTNQSLSLWYTCKFPYATATDDQGIVFSSCAQNNGSQGILYTYRDTQGNVQQGWVTSPGNGSCTNSWGLSVSRDGNYVFATCYGNPSNRQIMGYEKQMNGSTWYWNYMSLNTSNWACGKDIIYDSVTEDIYAICGPALGSVDTRIIKFPHNATSESYMNPQDLGIMANYIKYNPFNQYLYYATTSNLGYFSVNSDNGTSLPLSTNNTMPTNITVIPINGTLSNWCEITSFTFSHNSSNTLYVGCTGFHSIATSYTSYSILRIDANQTWISVNVTIPVVVTNTTDNSTSLINITTTQNITTWNYQVINISYTDSKLSGTDGNNDLTYPADGSCKGPSDMEMDSMNQLYVACTQNPSTRSVIRYTPINSTSYLPAYVTSAVVGCSHPLANSLSLNLRNDVLISCSADNKGLLFTTIQNSTLIPTNPPSNNSSSSTGGSGPTGNPTGNPTGSTGNPTSNPTGTGSSVICPGGVCVPTNTSSSTGTIGNTASHTRVNIAGVAFALVLLVVSM